MPGTAFALFLLFVVLAFGWRSILQWRRTGDFGFRAFSSSTPLAERLVSSGFALSLILVGAAPLLAWAGRSEPWPTLDLPLAHVLGLVLTLAGMALTLWAQLQMGAAWRLGQDASERTELVRAGLFGHVRNPIYSAMLLAGLGMVAMVPSALALVAWLLLFLSVETQVRRVEEPFLARVHGDAYRAYLREVGRFVPGLGRSSSA